jgi:murein DD-endopeptidase MepM/ murein hydrolase activator NlpD
MAVQPPLKSMRIRRDVPNNTFGHVRKQKDGTPRAHQGWDLAAPVGTPVYSVAEGEVIAATGDEGDYGKSITIAFLNSGKWLFAFYGHLSEVLCRVGDPVYRGQQIAISGASGNASSLPSADHHLHFEVRTAPAGKKGLSGRIDPGELLGFDLYQCKP